mmetsp:Transcript_40985/g.127742  ORF Transcript_40985/g.127742 Transcript_40985/m.127742 type:complete len:385 (+) Transcript_40985:143-1297(+)
MHARTRTRVLRTRCAEQTPQSSAARPGPRRSSFADGDRPRQQIGSRVRGRGADAALLRPPVRLVVGDLLARRELLPAPHVARDVLDHLGERVLAGGEAHGGPERPGHELEEAHLDGGQLAEVVRVLAHEGQGGQPQARLLLMLRVKLLRDQQAHALVRLPGQRGVPQVRTMQQSRPQLEARVRRQRLVSSAVAWQVYFAGLEERDGILVLDHVRVENGVYDDLAQALSLGQLQVRQQIGLLLLERCASHRSVVVLEHREVVVAQRHIAHGVHLEVVVGAWVSHVVANGGQEHAQHVLRRQQPHEGRAVHKQEGHVPSGHGVVPAVVRRVCVLGLHGLQEGVQGLRGRPEALQVEPLVHRLKEAQHGYAVLLQTPEVCVPPGEDL